MIFQSSFTTCLKIIQLKSINTIRPETFETLASAKSKSSIINEFVKLVTEVFESRVHHFDGLVTMGMTKGTVFEPDVGQKK